MTRCLFLTNTTGVYIDLWVNYIYCFNIPE